MKRRIHPMVQRWRAESSSGVLLPLVAAPKTRRPHRLWMTGSLAVVMAAMVPLRAACESERSQAMRLLQHSRYGVAETLQRIELAARERGLEVLARVGGALPVLVLASAIGGTLVVMNEADSRPTMPLGLMVSASAGGGVDVLVATARPGADRGDWSELPLSVVDDLRALPHVVERALR